jgi:hypothetical protein
VTPAGLSFGGWPEPPSKIVVRTTNKLLVYRERANRQCAQMAYSGERLAPAPLGYLLCGDRQLPGRQTHGSVLDHRLSAEKLSLRPDRDVLIDTAASCLRALCSVRRPD